MGEAEPDSTLFHGPQSLVHQWRAVGTGTGGDAVLFGKGVADFAGIIIPDIQGNDGTPVVIPEIAVDSDARDLLKGFVKSTIRN